ncbi:MAG: ABC transporter substrate-binding protein [Pseudanabaenaceae cyanobacterium bins.68]|nr:ABC transporter substrate-binding protein [Pseudanabaenaceae cyanobacterium bins.68]
MDKHLLALALSVGITTGVVGAGLWYFLSPRSVQLVSTGQTLLISPRDSAAQLLKEQGAAAIQRQEFGAAIDQFRAALKVKPNDPETRIYLTNAEILAKTKPLAIVGVSVPIGGNLNVAQEILRGVAQAQLEFKQAGVAIQLLIGDDANQNDRAQAIAQQFSQNPQVMAVVGHNTSDVTLAAAPIYQQSGLVMVSPTATANALSGFGSFIFRTAPSVKVQANSLARYAFRTNHQKFGICFSSQSASTRSLRDEFQGTVFAEGGKVSNVPCDLAAPGFEPTQVIQAFRQDQVQGILLAPGVETIDQGVAIAQAAGGRFLLLTDTTLYTFRTLQGGASLRGLVLAVPWHPGASLPGSFAARALGLWGGNVNWRSASAYDAFSAIATGLRESKFQSRSALQQVMIEDRFRAPASQGQLSFQASGDRVASVTLIQVQPGAKSGTGYDFVKLDF